MEYFIQYNGRTIGPMSAEQVMAYNVDENTPVCSDSGEWAPLFSYPELYVMLSSRSKKSSDGIFTREKDRVGTAVLAIVLGYLGAHYFYLGKFNGGLICLLLSVITCGAWSVLCLVQGIYMLGLSQEEFDRKYVYTDKEFPLF